MAHGWAAAFRAQGIDVTVVEVQDRLLARVTSPEVSQFFLERHRAAGVTVRLGVGVQGLRGEGGRVRAVVLANGEELPADLVVVGIGLVPNTEVLAAAGATVSNGIEVDEYCRTSLPNVSALGTAPTTSTSSRWGSGAAESVQNATISPYRRARPVGCRRVRATPWFWSNQYDIKLRPGSCGVRPRRGPRRAGPGFSVSTSPIPGLSPWTASTPPQISWSAGSWSSSGERSIRRWSRTPVAHSSSCSLRKGERTATNTPRPRRVAGAERFSGAVRGSGS